MILGVTYMDVTKTENNIKTRQLLTERFTGTWAISYRLNKNVLDIDGPMRAVTRSFRPTKRIFAYLEHSSNSLLISSKLRIVCWSENLLNWTPNREILLS
jgi:outer membrane receptor for ferrienterochelin and colicins